MTFYKLRDANVSNPETTFTVEEAHEQIREHKKDELQLKFLQLLKMKPTMLIEYYEEQSPGLGERFLKSLEDAYYKLSQTPQYYATSEMIKKFAI